MRAVCNRVIRGSLLVAALFSVGRVNADMIHAQITLARTFDVSPLAAGDTVTTFGSVRADAMAGANLGFTELNNVAKLVASGGPPPTIVSSNILTAVGPLSAPSAPLDTAQAIALIDLSQSSVTGSGMTIVSSQTVEYTLVDDDPLSNLLCASARTRDPLPFGGPGSGGLPFPSTGTVSFTVMAAGMGMLPQKALYVAQQMIAPGIITDPDTVFTMPPPGAQSMFRLIADPDPLIFVEFVPGVSSPQFQFSFDRTPAQIEAAFLNYLNGGPETILFTATVTFQGDATIYNQDFLTCTPEPSAIVLSLLGMGVLASVRTRRRRPR